MRHLKNKALLHAKRLHSKVRRTTHKEVFIHRDTPYFSQWESRDLVEKIVTKQVDAGSDPRWKESGAKTTGEYTSWSWSCCGMACLKMILAHKQHKIIPLVTLGKKCLEYGGYTQPVEKSPGLYYKPFAKFVKNEYGLDAKAVGALTLAEIKRVLSEGGYAMVSVTPEIRFPSKEPTKHGGHLVLIVGYDDSKGEIYLNNPSGFEDSQENVAIPYPQFRKFFDNKGILIKG